MGKDEHGINSFVQASDMRPLSNDNFTESCIDVKDEGFVRHSK